MNRLQKVSLDLVRAETLARKPETRSARWTLWMRHLWRQPNRARGAVSRAAAQRKDKI